MLYLQQTNRQTKSDHRFQQKKKSIRLFDVAADRATRQMKAEVSIVENGCVRKFVISLNRALKTVIVVSEIISAVNDSRRTKGDSDVGLKDGDVEKISFICKCQRMSTIIFIYLVVDIFSTIIQFTRFLILNSN